MSPRVGVRVFREAAQYDRLRRGVVVYTSGLLVPIPAEVRLPRTFLLDGHRDCLIVLVALLDDDFYRRRHFIRRVGVGRPLLRRRGRLRGRRGAGVHSHFGGSTRLPLVVDLARDAASLSARARRTAAGRRSQPLAKVAVRARRAGFRGGRCLLTAFLGLRRGLAPPVEPSERGARLSKWGSKTQLLSLARRAVRRRNCSTCAAGAAQILPWGSTIGSGRNSSAALPRVAEHP